jgi:hypothetical protein
VKTKLLSLKSLSLAVLLCSAAAAQADITVYTDRAAFLAAVGNSATDTFNDLSMVETASPLNRSINSYSYRASAGPVGDFFPAGSAADIWLSTLVANDTITFSNFSAGVRGFGGNFFGSDFNGAFLPGKTIVLTASDGSTTRTVNLYDTTVNSFLGFVSTDPFSTISLRNDAIPGNVYWPTVNNVTLAVPEPETWGMLLAGLCLLGGMATRRR